jgi:ribonuclease Z
MRPFLHATLINGRFGDPAVYIETLFEKEAVLLDLGDISALPPRKILRVQNVFVSHAHIDHFFGFDLLLRVLVGRGKQLRLFGPEGFAGQVSHKLQGYRWNLVGRYPSDLALIVTEIGAELNTHTVRFRLKEGFRGEDLGRGRAVDGVIHQEPIYRVVAAVLDHGTPVLGFAVEEAAHVNVWKNRLVERGLSVGPWLRMLKRAIMENRPDDYRITVETPSGDSRAASMGELRDLVTVTAGQKIAYVTDVRDSGANRQAILKLAENADLLFIEAAFAEADGALAAERAHLTTGAAGRIARAAGVRRLEVFHFSPRYEGDEARMLAEAMAAFEGRNAR